MRQINKQVRKQIKYGCHGALYSVAGLRTRPGCCYSDRWTNNTVLCFNSILFLQSNSVQKRDRSNKNTLHYCTGQKDLLPAASIAMTAPELIESADEDGFTPLHLSVIQGNLAVVNLLLANKADVNALDNEGHSVVHWATGEFSID